MILLAAALFFSIYLIMEIIFTSVSGEDRLNPNERMGLIITVSILWGFFYLIN